MDPAIIGRSAKWYKETNPQRFFEQERQRGLIYVIGIYDPKLGAEKSPVPGISRQDAHHLFYRTWFVPAHFYADPELNKRFLNAARNFAERYNPIVVQYLKSAEINNISNFGTNNQHPNKFVPLVPSCT